MNYFSLRKKQAHTLTFLNLVTLWAKSLEIQMHTDYRRPVRKPPSLQGQKSTPTPKSSQIFRFLWFMPSLGVRSPCKCTLYRLRSLICGKIHAIIPIWFNSMETNFTGVFQADQMIQFLPLYHPCCKYFYVFLCIKCMNALTLSNTFNYKAVTIETVLSLWNLSYGVSSFGVLYALVESLVQSH